MHVYQNFFMLLTFITYVDSNSCMLSYAYFDGNLWMLLLPFIITLTVTNTMFWTLPLNGDGNFYAVDINQTH